MPILAENTVSSVFAVITAAHRIGGEGLEKAGAGKICVDLVTDFVQVSESRRIAVVFSLCPESYTPDGWCVDCAVSVTAKSRLTLRKRARRYSFAGTESVYSLVPIKGTFLQYPHCGV
jgi:hypothetical protein